MRKKQTIVWNHIPVVVPAFQYNFATTNHSPVFPLLTNQKLLSVALCLVRSNFKFSYWSIPKREHPVPHRRTSGCSSQWSIRNAFAFNLNQSPSNRTHRSQDNHSNNSFPVKSSPCVSSRLPPPFSYIPLTTGGCLGAHALPHHCRPVKGSWAKKICSFYFSQVTKKLIELGYVYPQKERQLTKSD